MELKVNEKHRIMFDKNQENKVIMNENFRDYIVFNRGKNDLIIESPSQFYNGHTYKLRYFVKNTNAKRLTEEILIDAALNELAKHIDSFSKDYSTLEGAEPRMQIYLQKFPKVVLIGNSEKLTEKLRPKIQETKKTLNEEQFEKYKACVKLWGKSLKAYTQKLTKENENGKDYHRRNV